MDPIAAFIQQQGFMVLDGGLATELEVRGLELDKTLWSASILVEQPEAIQKLHCDYLAAGADCIISASYQATVQGFEAFGMDRSLAEAILRRSLELALAARAEVSGDAAAASGRCRPLVAASIGPYGAYLADGSEYRGDYGLDVCDLEAFHRPRWQVLAGAGADLFACETIPSVVEARALIRLLRKSPDLNAWFSFQARDGAHIADGTAFARVVEEIDSEGQILAVGVNCTAPELVGDLIRIAKNHTDKPVVVYPNSGEEWDAERRRWTPASGQCSFDELAFEWFTLGARLIGGCCRTGPETVKKVRNRLTAAWRLHP